jgi:hypothetical protein
MQPTQIYFTASFYYQPEVIISITVGLLEYSPVIGFFPYELTVMHLLVLVLKFQQ